MQQYSPWKVWARKTAVPRYGNESLKTTVVQIQIDMTCFQIPIPVTKQTDNKIKPHKCRQEDRKSCKMSSAEERMVLSL